MKIVKFLGGLGNQMFQYVFYLSLQRQFKNVRADLTDFDAYTLHNGFELEKIFALPMHNASNFSLKLLLPQNRKWIWKRLRRVLGAKNAYWEDSPQFAYHEHIYQDRKPKYYWGYWQHINYFEGLEPVIRQQFSFPEIKDIKNSSLLQHIETSNSVAIHVRRGDYLEDPALGGICDDAYYKSAIDYIKTHVASPVFIIFSNDITWCQTNFKDLNAEFVDWNVGANSYIDMQLMSKCKHFIIANSSFSWWASWLQPNNDKIVVSPKKWVNDPLLDTSGLILPSFVTF